MLKSTYLLNWFFWKTFQNYFLKMQNNNMLCWYHSCFLCKKLALNIHTYRKHTFEEFWDVLTSKQSMYFFKTSTSKIINDMFLLLDFSYQNYHTFLQFCIYYTVLYRHTQDNPIYWQKQSFNITNFPVKFLTQQTTPRGKWTSCSK